MSPGISSLEDLLDARAAVRTWLADAKRESGASGADLDEDQFLLVFSSAGRHLGKGSIDIQAGEIERLEKSGLGWGLGRWSLDELGRVLLLGAAVVALPSHRAASLVEACYARGDNRERQAVLRALPFLPEAGRFVPLAVDACRTSVQTIFESIACENPFPADEFPDLNFNQMVLKAMFNGVALARIVRLGDRAGADLARMAADYAAERRAAGRTVPADIDLVLGPRGGNGG
jgi:hypothetical protein